MASAISHPAIVAALAPIFGSLPRRALWCGAVCAVLPDVDAVGFWLGVPYDHPLGHRGLGHSVPFAAALAGVLAAAAFPAGSRRGTIFFFLFLCTASHGLFDALTDGGLGVAFFAPFSNARYFFPWRPIRVSPIGVSRFFSERGLSVLASELVWIWAPSLAVGAVAWWLLHARAAGH